MLPDYTFDLRQKVRRELIKRLVSSKNGSSKDIQDKKKRKTLTIFMFFSFFHFGIGERKGVFSAWLWSSFIIHERRKKSSYDMNGRQHLWLGVEETLDFETIFFCWLLFLLNDPLWCDMPAASFVLEGLADHAFF